MGTPLASGRALPLSPHRPPAAPPPRGISGNVWRCLWLSSLGRGCSWNLRRRGQGSCHTALSAQAGLTTENIHGAESGGQHSSEWPGGQPRGRGGRDRRDVLQSGQDRMMSDGDKGLVEKELDRGPLSRYLSDGGDLGRGVL